jgi:hypothetical protein
VTGTTFDPGGLKTSLASASDLSHLLDSGATAGYLMTPAITSGQRREIRSLELNMLDMALGYTPVPEPATALWGALGFGHLRHRPAAAPAATVIRVRDFVQHLRAETN